MTRNLDISVGATHEVLQQRLHNAVTSHDGGRHGRGDSPETDDFLASTSRHLAAVHAVLLPQARDGEAGSAHCKRFIRQSRSLELALGEVKGKLYGDANARHRTWTEIWGDVKAELDRTLALEQRLVDELNARVDDEQLDSLALRMYHAELRAPTRPHPYLPHQGVGGQIARRVAHTVDSFWDATEGRLVPEPVRAPRDHSGDGRLVHYLLADIDPSEAPGGRPEPG